MKRVLVLPLLFSVLLLASCRGVSTVERYHVAHQIYVEVTPVAVTAIEEGYKAGHLDKDDVELALKADKAAKLALDMAGAALVAGDNEACLAALGELVRNLNILQELAQ